MGIAPDGAPDAHAQYTHRLRERRLDAERRTRTATVVSHLRLAVFLTGGVGAWFVFGNPVLALRWLALPAGLFMVLVMIHDRLLTRRDLALRSAAFYERGIARLEGRWMGKGAFGERFRTPHHPYTDDLDVLGEGSLYEWLCGARTRAGEDILAGWLSGAASHSAILARQAAVGELRGRLDLREDLARLGEIVRADFHPNALRTWGEAPPEFSSKAPAVVAAGLSIGALSTLILWIATPMGAFPFLLMLVLGSGFSVAFRRRFREIIGGVELPGADLKLFAHLLERLEDESFTTPRLVALRSSLEAGHKPASRCIARLRFLVDLLDARRNQFFLPAAIVLLWTPNLALAIDRWRVKCGPALGRWIEAVGEIEALGAFAAFSYEHPDFPFPEIVEGSPCFEGVAVGHPLLPLDRCVRNDVSLSARQQVLIVSGSNMSGKSTLLRTVGTNTVLALAGAPVCAERLRVSRMNIGASIRTGDSLLDGSSRFYAEILRLREITELTEGELPTLFLLDEILHGTNSHDRGIGAEAVVRNLIDSGGVGLVTTHDLALTRLGENLEPRAVNVHFQDHLEGGKIAFDYRVHPGVVTKSNALDLMRAIGLDV